MLKPTVYKTQTKKPTNGQHKPHQKIRFHIMWIGRESIFRSTYGTLLAVLLSPDLICHIRGNGGLDWGNDDGKTSVVICKVDIL